MCSQSFALLVPSCCDKSGTICYHFVTRLMTVTDLLQVVSTRLKQAIRNKLLRTCCHQLVNNLLGTDDIRLVGRTVLACSTCSRLVNTREHANASCCQAVRLFLRVCSLNPWLGVFN